MSKPLLKISNHHGADCGEPPVIEEVEGRYIGYFANCHGEQWIFSYDRQTGVGSLSGGDISWKTIEIDGGIVNQTLSDDERMWLTACWRAATAFSKPSA